MCEVIVVTSGKGGVGKTTTSANIGTGLASLGNRVVMIDTDIGLRNLDVVLGLENRIVYNLIDVIEGNCRYKQALIKARNYNNLYLLPCAQTRDKTAVSPEQIIKLIDEIAADKANGEKAIDTLMVAKYFERIGDHAVNIAEWVVFSVTGVHKTERIM